MRHFDLSGTWKLRFFDGQRGDSLARMIDPAFDLSHAWDAQVPGDVHETLLKLGLIREPSLGLNSLESRWVEEKLWFYRRTFDAPPRSADERVWLTFESLDLAAVVYLNGKEIGRHSNRFYPFRVDVTDALIEGPNTLLVQVESGLFFGANKSAQGLGLAIDSELTKRSWLRKPQSTAGWDWSPRLLTVGILGPVYLQTVTQVRVEQISAFTKLSDDLNQGVLEVRALLQTFTETPVKCRVEIPELGLIKEESVSFAKGTHRLSTQVTVLKPELWWPVGHGLAKRYEVIITLESSNGLLARETRKVGFRHIRINQDRHPVTGQYFIVEINRKPIFLKGANFVPADLIDRRVTPEHTAKLVELALAANFNCLRVWGGGIYETEAFYDLCDQHGVLVWQEFIFACAKYPATDEAFLADVRREAAYQIRRLAFRPSLFLWCGNNEMEWGNFTWDTFEKGVMFPDHGLFHVVLPKLMREEDPSRPYHPSSPYSPPGIEPNDFHYGDQHPWSVGFAETDFRLYRQMTCRFPNEGGFLGPAALPTVHACLTPDDPTIGSFAWEHHENSISYWFKSCAPNEALEKWLGRSIKTMSVEDYVFLSGMLQGEALGEFIKNFRRRMFDTAAAIFWMYNDVWPTVRSWVIVDYYLRHTPSFHPVRRAFAPVTVVITEEDAEIRIYGVNEGSIWNGSLQFGICSLTGKYPLTQQMEVTLPANSSTCIATFSREIWDKLGVQSHIAYALLSKDDHLVAQDRLILPKYLEMEWPEAKIELSWDGSVACFTSDHFAWNVCLDLDGEASIPDNFFDLLPGIPRRLPWPPHLGEPKILHVGNEIRNRPV